MTIGFKIKGKGKRLVPTDSKTPHRCVLLAFDVAQNSGYCVAAMGHYVESGELDERRADFGEKLDALMARTSELARDNDVPCVLIREKPFARNPEVTATLYRVRRKIGDSWMGIMSGRDAQKRVDTYPQTWRSRVLGATSGPQLPHLEAQEANLFSFLATSVFGPDENAAICIAKWGTTAGEVAKVIPKRFWGSSE